MPIIDLINGAIAPVIITVLYILYLKGIFPKRKWVEDYFKNIPEAPKGMRFDFSRPMTIILTSFLSVLFIDLILKIVFGHPMLPYDEPMWYGIIVRGIFNPIAEEVVFRGFFLGILSFIFIELIRKSAKNNLADVCYVPFLIFWSFVFMLSHNDWRLVPDIARFLLGILCGTLYLLSKRNLAVPITAHSIHNILIVIGYFQMM